MKQLMYPSGEKIEEGDRINYHGEPGQVELIALQQSGDPARDWYLERFSGGGLMIRAEGFGSVFLGIGEIDDQLELVARRTER